jgi:hypothetical protein
MKIKTLQSIANSIISGLENTKHDEIADLYYEIGMWFDNFCIKYMGVYLD